MCSASEPRRTEPSFRQAQAWTPCSASIKFSRPELTQVTSANSRFEPVTGRRSYTCHGSSPGSCRGASAWRDSSPSASTSSPSCVRRPGRAGRRCSGSGRQRRRRRARSRGCCSTLPTTIPSASGATRSARCAPSGRTSGPRPSTRWVGRARSRYAFTWTQRVPRLEAVEAHEDLDDAPISERDVVADGVELSIEGHRCPARPAARIVGLGRDVGLAADAMARPNLGRRPLETGRGLGLRGQWVCFQAERRDALRHAAQATPRRCRNEAKEQCSATRPGSSHERVRPLHRACCRTRHDRDELSAAV